MPCFGSDGRLLLRQPARSLSRLPTLLSSDRPRLLPRRPVPEAPAEERERQRSLTGACGEWTVAADDDTTRNEQGEDGVVSSSQTRAIPKPRLHYQKFWRVWERSFDSGDGVLGSAAGTFLASSLESLPAHVGARTTVIADRSVRRRLCCACFITACAQPTCTLGHGVLRTPFFVVG